jgi:hypothetical protein
MVEVAKEKHKFLWLIVDTHLWFLSTEFPGRTTCSGDQQLATTLPNMDLQRQIKSPQVWKFFLAPKLSTTTSGIYVACNTSMYCAKVQTLN